MCSYRDERHKNQHSNIFSMFINVMVKYISQHLYIVVLPPQWIGLPETEFEVINNYNYNIYRLVNKSSTIPKLLP